MENNEENAIMACFEVLKEELDEDNHRILVRSKHLRTTSLSMLSLYPRQDLEILDGTEQFRSLTKIPGQDGMLGTEVHQNQDVAKLSVPLNLFIDDTSTNISRKWLPMHCAQIQLAG